MRWFYQVRRDIALSDRLAPFSKVIALILMTVTVSAPSPAQATISQSGQNPAETAPATKPARSEPPAGEAKDSPNADAIKEIDVESLVRESDANGALMLKRLLEYTYTLKKIRRVLNGDGKPLSERVDTFEAYPIRGQHVLIQVTSDGVPLPSSFIAEERRRAGQNLLQAENAAKKQGDEIEAAPGGTKNYLAAGISGISRRKYASVTVDISEILRSCEFSSPRADRLNGREMIALNFRPRADARFPLNKQYISKLVGVVWIDAVEKVVARVEAQAAPNPLEYQIDRGPVLIYEQARQQSGAWFPVLIRLNTRGDESLANGLNWDVVFELGEFRRFTSTADEVKIKDPDKPKSHE